MKKIMAKATLRRTLVLSTALALTAGLTTYSNSALGAIVFSDDFSSPDGPLLGTTPDVSTGNWTITGTSVVNPLMIVSQQVPMANTGQDAYAAFSATVPNAGGTSMHTSADINVSAAQATGDYFLHVSDPAGTSSNFYQRLFARSTAGGYQLGLLDTSGAGSVTTWGTTALSFNTTYDVDITWNFVAGALNDTFAVSVNNAPYLTHSWTSTLAEPAQLAAANLRQGSSSNAATLKVDNIVVTAIPEPSTFALGGMLGLLALGRRRLRA